MSKIILASASPRRKELLNQIGIDFEVKVADVDESTILTRPDNVVEYLSSIKAQKICDEICYDCIIIAADTIVSLEGNILGKPKSENMAYDMIKSIQNREHEVYTGVTIIVKDDGNVICDTFSCCTKVFVKKMTDKQIKEYISLDEPYDKAGAYGIQGVFARHIDHIEGDYYNVVGLPVSAIYEKIEKYI